MSATPHHSAIPPTTSVRTWWRSTTPTKWTLIYYDAEQHYTYIKRFTLEDSERKELIQGEEENRIILLSDEPLPRFLVSFTDEDAHREAIEVDAEQFIGVKSVRAKGKRVSNYKVGKWKSWSHASTTHLPRPPRRSKPKRNRVKKRIAIPLTPLQTMSMKQRNKRYYLTLCVPTATGGNISLSLQAW